MMAEFEKQVINTTLEKFCRFNISKTAEHFGMKISRHCLALPCMQRLNIAPEERKTRTTDGFLKDG